MVHDRNNKHDDQEDSEYHFSDDEVSYEGETDAAKAPQPASSKENIMKRFTGSKRLIASGVVFFILLMVVYKIFSSGGTASGDIMPITPVPPVAAIQKTPPVVVVTTQTTRTTTPPLNNPGQTPAQVAQQNLNEEQVVDAMIAKLTAFTADNEKRLSQLQADYTQKINDYAAQNKQLQDQVQMLAAKLGSVETQMNQLTQVLMQQGKPNNTTSSENTSASPPHESKVPYSVQAIIPGRAWLKSENGETVTIAEGDTIKGLGRVTKIDPYDGIVEVNTGNKAVSLSYGSGG